MKCHESYTDIKNDWSHWRKLVFLGQKLIEIKNDYSAKMGKNEKKIGQKLEKMSKTVKIRKNARSKYI